jgi:hypothetical protein
MAAMVVVIAVRLHPLSVETAKNLLHRRRVTGGAKTGLYLKATEKGELGQPGREGSINDAFAESMGVSPGG